MCARQPIRSPELKRQAAGELASLFEGWNIFDVAAHVGTDARRITEIKRGQLERFSLETLIRYLARMHRVVELRITKEFPTQRRPKPPTESKRER